MLLRLTIVQSTVNYLKRQDLTFFHALCDLDVYNLKWKSLYSADENR